MHRLFTIASKSKVYFETCIKMLFGEEKKKKERNVGIYSSTENTKN